MMSDPTPPFDVPPGPWAIGVSGGADSVALLSFLRLQPGLRLHVVHLDHQTRGDASTADAAFVADLAATWELPATIATRTQFELRMLDLPTNPSARFRAIRLALFREVVADHNLDGVILAHHADDQAETVFARLLRGSGWAGLCGMDGRANVGGLVIRRPLLGVDRATLRRHLRRLDQPWREDASNASDDYQRNRLRRVLADHPQLTPRLLELADACRSLRDWARAAAPKLEASFDLAKVLPLPPILARESLARWLVDQGIPPADLARAPAAVDRLLAMTSDAAGPAKSQFPGGVTVRRRKGKIERAEPR